MQIGQWQKKWIRRQRSVKKALRNSHVYAVLGHHVFHRPLWKADKRSLSGGLALGLFIAFTPTIPFQMLLAAAGAMLFNVNLPVALAACWLTNPLTAVPIYMSAWRTGRFLIGQAGPIRDFIDLVADKTGSGRFIRHSLYLWSGSLLYASAAATAGRAVARLLWDAGKRIARARKRIEHRTPLRDILKSLVPVTLLVFGLVLQKLGWIDLETLSDALVRRADLWWMAPALIGLMTVMYALALPGSALMVVAGILYAPPLATAIAVAGGTVGSAAAFCLARNLSPAYAARYADSWLFQALRGRSGFPLLCALRALPGFPHAVISYSAGVLGAGLPAFLASSLIGFGVKGFVYTSAVYDAAHLGPETRLWSFQVLWPLLALVLLALTGLMVERRLSRHGLRHRAVPRPETNA